jgi:hypothetical protein
MVTAVRISTIALAHFALTAGCVIGGGLVAVYAMRQGLPESPVAWVILRDAARVLAWPSSKLITAGLAGDGLSFWVVIGANSLMWAFVITFGWKWFRKMQGANVA